jgi:hypothetical protein
LEAVTLFTLLLLTAAMLMATMPGTLVALQLRLVVIIPPLTP